jgi:hypothetical protein
VIRIGEGVEPDEALHAYVEPCFLFHLSSGGSCRRFARLDPPTGRADCTFPLCRPGEQDSSGVVEDDRDGDGDRVNTHRRKLLEADTRPRLGRPCGSEDARLANYRLPREAAVVTCICGLAQLDAFRRDQACGHSARRRLRNPVCAGGPRAGRARKALGPSIDRITTAHPSVQA